MQYEKILIVAAHPDDEVLGAGGSIARWISEFRQVEILVLCENGKRHDRDSLPFLQAAAEVLGANVTCLGLDDQSLEYRETAHLAKVVGDLMDQLDPRLVVTHSQHDLNADHRKAFEVCAINCRPSLGGLPRELWEMYVPSASEPYTGRSFQPNTWVALTEQHMTRKCAALSCYDLEVQNAPHPRSIDGVLVTAKFYGQQMCVDYAEAFRCVHRLLD